MGFTAADFLKQNYKDDEKICLGINAFNLVTVNEAIKFIYSDDMEWVPDQYMSISTMQPYAKTRCKKMVKNIKFFAIDLDVWHDENKYSNVSKMDVLNLLYNKIFDKGLIMEPDIINFTGRGFLLLWRVFKDEKHTLDLNYFDHFVWEKIQLKIADVFKDFCVDPNCVTDYARVYRMIGSINSNSGECVECIDALGEGSVLSEWVEWAKLNTITEKQNSLINKMMSYGIVPEYKITTKRQAYDFIKSNKKIYRNNVVSVPSKKQIKLCEALAKKHNVKLPEDVKTDWVEAKKFIDAYQVKQSKVESAGSYICCMRIIEAVIDENGDRNGLRELLLWIYRICHFALNNDECGSLDAVLKLNEKFSWPLLDKEVTRATRSAVKHNGKYKGVVCSILAKVLDCKFAELKGKYYTKKSYTKEERRVYDRERYINDVHKKGNYTKEEIICDRRWNVNRLMEDGKTNDEIASELGMSVRQVQRDKAAIKRGDKIFNLNIICVACPDESTAVLSSQQLYRNRKERASWIKEHKKTNVIAELFSKVYGSLFEDKFYNSDYVIGNCIVSGKVLRQKILDKLTINDLINSVPGNTDNVLVKWIQIIEERYDINVRYNSCIGIPALKINYLYDKKVC